MAVEDIILADDVTWAFDGRTSGTISSTISDDGSTPSPTLTFKYNNGDNATYTIAGTSPNTYGGTTVVESARLILNKDGAIPGDLMVGKTNGFARSPDVRVTYASAVDDRIADSASVFLYSDGTKYAKIILDADVNEKVKRLYIDDVEQAAGTWGATGSGADNINDNYFVGSGMLTVDPTASIALSDIHVDEGLPAGTQVGSFSVLNTSGTFTYSLVESGSYPDNASFDLTGVNNSDLVTDAVFDFETQNSYSIRVLASEGGNPVVTNTFRIFVDQVSAFREFLFQPYGAAVQYMELRTITFTTGAEAPRVTHLGFADVKTGIANGTVIGTPETDPDNWGDGLSGTYTVTLTKTDPSEVVAQVTVGPDTTLYDTGFRWEELPVPVDLEPNTGYSFARTPTGTSSDPYPLGGGIPANWNDYYGTLTYSQYRNGEVNLATTPIPPSGTVFIFR